MQAYLRTTILGSSSTGAVKVLVSALPPYFLLFFAR